MSYNPTIFKAYDIRGKYGEDFDIKFPKELGIRFSKHINANTIIVARDSRPSSTEIATSLIAGLTSIGCNVINIGETSTPLFYFGVIEENADGGIMVSASHLGDEYNGFKVCGPKAQTIAGTELLELFNSPLPKETPQGKIEKKNILDIHNEITIQKSGLIPNSIKLKVGIISNEMILNEIMPILKTLKIELGNENPDIIFEFDPDGDRVSVRDKNNNPIRGDSLGGAMVMHFYKDKPIAYDIRYSRGVLEYWKKNNVNFTVTRVGHTLIKKLMREKNLIFGAEGSGHIFFKETGYVESSALAMLKILDMLNTTEKTINELTAPFSTWSYSGELNTKIESHEKINKIFLSLKNKYSDGIINEFDGLKIEYPDWGFLVRSSNTEALLRLIVEAKEKEAMNLRIKELQDLIME